MFQLKIALINLITLSTLAVTLCLVSCTAESEKAASKGKTIKNISADKAEEKPIMVRVNVNDDTEKKPVHTKAEIWFLGYGSWWLKNEIKHGGAFKNLGTRISGTQHTLIIYPESRQGTELQVPYMMTKDMNPNGSARDMISVTISDSEITVHGIAIQEANGKFEMKYKR